MKTTFLYWNNINFIKLGRLSFFQRLKLRFLLNIGQLLFAEITVKDRLGFKIKVSPSLISTVQIITD